MQLFVKMPHSKKKKKKPAYSITLLPEQMPLVQLVRSQITFCNIKKSFFKGNEWKIENGNAGNYTI